MSLALEPPSELTVSETPKTNLAEGGGASPTWPFIVLAVLAIIVALYWGRDLIIPIVLAFFLSLLLRPVLRRTRKIGVPDIVSSFAIIFLIAALFVGSLYSLVGQGTYWLAAAPTSIERVRRMVFAYAGPMDDLAKATEAFHSLTRANS